MGKSCGSFSGVAESEKSKDVVRRGGGRGRASESLLLTEEGLDIGPRILAESLRLSLKDSPGKLDLSVLSALPG